MAKKKTLSERKEDFKERLRPYLERYGKKTLNEFYFYWTEHNEGGKKMRFEMQKVFCISRRLTTWKRNNETNFNKQPKQNMIQSGNESMKKHFQFKRNESKSPLLGDTRNRTSNTIQIGNILKP